MGRPEGRTLAGNLGVADVSSLHLRINLLEVTCEVAGLLEVLAIQSDGGTARGRAHDTGGVPEASEAEREETDTGNDVLERERDSGACPHTAIVTTTTVFEAIVTESDSGLAATLALATSASAGSRAVADDIGGLAELDVRIAINPVDWFGKGKLGA